MGDAALRHMGNFLERVSRCCKAEWSMASLFLSSVSWNRSTEVLLKSLMLFNWCTTLQGIAMPESLSFVRSAAQPPLLQLQQAVLDTGAALIWWNWCWNKWWIPYQVLYSKPIMHSVSMTLAQKWLWVHIQKNQLADKQVREGHHLAWWCRFTGGTGCHQLGF